MSYILEALKKSDSERKQQSQSLPLQDLAPLASRKRTTSFSLLIPVTLLALLVGIGATTWYQNYRQTVQEDPPVINSTLTDPTLSPAPEITEEIVLDVFEPAPILHLPAVNTKRIYASKKNVRTHNNTDIPRLKELPATIQAQIPPLKFAGHAYAQDPARRMIIINNKILKEGDTVDKGLLLKEITANGVILSYKTILFQNVLDEPDQ